MFGPHRCLLGHVYYWLSTTAILHATPAVGTGVYHLCLLQDAYLVELHYAVR